MAEIELAGCRPEPLMSYLKALGIFRVVAEQVDPNACVSWSGGVAHLRSRLECQDVVDFFLSEYQPSPIVGPWGARSGFYPGSSESSAREALDAIVAAAPHLPRLAMLRDAIVSVRELLGRSGFREKVKDQDKLTLMRLCRAELSDSLLPWLDAVFILTEDSRRFPPLLGTGGNEGSGSYVSTFAQLVVSLLINREDDSGARAALFGEFAASVTEVAVGHFNPGAVGGPNSSQGFEGRGGVNAWDYLLAMEGCLMFAGAAARRYATDASPRAAYPFCVEAVPVGYASECAQESAKAARAELWLPLWSSWVSAAELSHLFGEGRAQLGRRQARNAVEFALALATLGVSAGIGGFVRYAFVMRNGLSYFAAPLGRLDVQPRPRARLLYDPPLADWIQKLRDACADPDKTPARYVAALRQIDRSIYAFVNRSDRGDDTPYLLDVLRAVGKAERTLAAGLAFCKDKHLSPLQGLSADWLIEAAPPGEHGREFRLAASLASVMAEPEPDPDPGALRTHLEPVTQKGRWFNWLPGSTSAVWSSKPLADNLAAVLQRRLLESKQARLAGCGLRAQVCARLEDVVAFINHETDDDLLGDLLWSLIGLGWHSAAMRRAGFKKRRAAAFRSPRLTPTPAAFALVRLTLTPLKLATETLDLPAGTQHRWRVASSGERPTIAVNPSAEPFQRLARGDLEEAVSAAASRIWSDRAVPFGWANRRARTRRYDVPSNLDPTRLLAACIFPLSSSSLTHLSRRALSPPAPESR